jgi:RNA polymerase sigma-70 factor (ECF subfamily)
LWHYVGMTVVEADSTLDVTQLVRQHQADVWRYLRYLGAAPTEAEDLTQETFLEVLRKPFQQRSSAETAAYLRTVARNRLLMQRRSQSRKPATIDVDQLDDVWVATTGSTGSLDPYLEALRHCLETSLDERQKSAIAMRYQDGDSRQEMASALQLSADGVKTLLRRARQALRDCIQGRLGLCPMTGKK